MVADLHGGSTGGSGGFGSRQWRSLQTGSAILSERNGHSNRAGRSFWRFGWFLSTARPRCNSGHDRRVRAGLYLSVNSLARLPRSESLCFREKGRKSNRVRTASGSDLIKRCFSYLVVLIAHPDPVATARGSDTALKKNYTEKIQ